MTELYEPHTLTRWTAPDYWSGTPWPDYFVFLGRNRDSDDLTESNFACGLRAIGGESDTVVVVRERHWACGWIEWIAIHESDSAALEAANEIMEALSDYPVIDEADWSERETESANTVWRNCYNPSERVEYIREHRYQFDFLDFRDMLRCVRGAYFAGYAEELLY